MNHDQLDLAFVADLEPAAVPPLKPTRSRSVRAQVAAAPVASVAAATPEAMARTLQAHPDYRVLRRLQPRLQWPAPTPGATLCRMLLLDTETTGLDASREKIIELALLRVDVDMTTGLPCGTVQIYDGLEDPGKPIPKEIEAITGIRTDMVRGQRLDEVRVAELCAGVDLVVAHNAGFDRPFVEGRLGGFADLAWACSVNDIAWKTLGHGSARLESLALDCGWFYDAHRAEMDCHALLAVLAQPLPIASGTSASSAGIESTGATGLARLMASATQPSFRLQATAAPFDAKDLLKARGYRWNAEQRVWHTRLPDEVALQAECAWLREQVYKRPASVQVEKLNAQVRYANRNGAWSSVAV